MTIRPSDETLAQYQALATGCGYHLFPQRTILELTGPDRATFLHNFCTAEIKKLPPGSGTEAFITNVQGKTVGYLYVLIGNDHIALEGAAGQAAALLPHLEKYLMLSNAELADRSGQWSILLVAGKRAADVLREVTSSEVPAANGNIELEIGNSKVVVAHVSFTGPDSCMLIGETNVIESLGRQLSAAGAVACGGEAVEMRRLEAGSPQFGSDVTEANLPQEVCRDRQAISFTKGCYLGQETVARIDALGHVNRYLKLVRFESEVIPEPGWEHSLEGKLVMKVTSACYSPLLESPLALAYIRRGHEKIGTSFETGLGRAEIIQSPNTPLVGNLQ